MRPMSCLSILMCKYQNMHIVKKITHVCILHTHEHTVRNINFWGEERVYD